MLSASDLAPRSGLRPIADSHGNTTAAALIEGLRERPVSAHVPISVLWGNLAIGGVPTDDTLARTIVRHRVHYRAKPYPGVKLAADLRLALGDQKG